MTDGSVCAAVAPEGRGVYLVPNGSLNFEAMGDGTASLVVSSGGQSPREFGVSYGLEVTFQCTRLEFRADYLFQPAALVHSGSERYWIPCAFPIYANGVQDYAVPAGAFIRIVNTPLVMDSFYKSGEPTAFIWGGVNVGDGLRVCLIDDSDYSIAPNGDGILKTQVDFGSSCQDAIEFSDTFIELPSVAPLCYFQPQWNSCRLDGGDFYGVVRCDLGSYVQPLDIEVVGISANANVTLDFNDLVFE